MIRLEIHIHDEGDRMGVRLTGESSGFTTEDEAKHAFVLSRMIDTYTDAIMTGKGEPELAYLVRRYIPLGTPVFWLASLGGWLKDKLKIRNRTQDSETTREAGGAVLEFLNDIEDMNEKLTK